MKTYQAAVKALREKESDIGNDFCHAPQRMNKPVLDFIVRLEQVFQTGFEQEYLSNETGKCCCMDNYRKV